MNLLKRYFLPLLLAVLAAPLAPAAPAPLPDSPSPHYIRDDAGWLDAPAFSALDEKLKAYERETSSQFVVAIFPRIPEGWDLFGFSQSLFERWKPGQADKDNGAVLIFFAEDRKLRIHTGYGMEGVLPDARCQQIIREDITPLLRQGRRAEAVNAGIDAMIASAKGEYKGTGGTALDRRNESKHSNIGGFLFLGILFLVILSQKSKRLIMYGPRGTTWTNAGGWITGGPVGRGGWGSSSGGGFSGGSSGGGFSGGGGGSGGGGSSGSW
jgi:uncharacterized protein